MLLMRDSVTAADIPVADLAAVAGYVDGVYAWSPADWARFPDPIVKLAIAVHPQDRGDILDVELGDAQPSDIPGWCDRNPHGLNGLRRAPTVYCSLSAWGTCKAAAGGRAVDWWIASYITTDPPGDPTQVAVIAGAVAQQFHDFGGYDESVVFDPTWLGADMTYTDQDIQAQIREWYYELLVRGVESNEAMAYHVGVWKTKGKDVCMAEIADGQEAQQANTSMRKLLGLA